MESATARKRFCSDKCRVYFGREIKMAEKQSDKIILELDKIAKNSPNFAFKPENSKTTTETNKMPPDGLKGIDLTIWKSENWK